MLVVAGQPAPATIVDTFDFTETGWMFIFGGVVFDAELGDLTGSFSGAVEPDGSIQQGDLTDFKTGFAGNLPKFASANLSLFSFNTSGGPSSLDFVVSDPFEIVCVGAAVFLSPACALGGSVPPFAHARSFFTGGEVPAFTGTFPQITLVSSVTAVPEPSTWAMFVVGLTAIGLARIVSRRTAAGGSNIAPGFLDRASTGRRAIRR